MAVSMASFCPLDSPTFHPLFPSSSSSHPAFSSYCRRNAHHGRKRRAITACKQHHDSNNGVFRHRRSILLMGFSVPPFLNSKSNAVEDRAPAQLESSSKRMQELNQIAQKEPEGDALLDAFLDLANGLRMIVLGVLGALYVLTLKENSIKKATIKSMKGKLADKDFMFISWKRIFDLKLAMENQERLKLIAKTNREKDSLVNEINSAIKKAKGIEQELDEENYIRRNLTTQINNLSDDFKKAFEDKDELKQQVNEKLCLVKVLQEKVNKLSAELKGKEDELDNAKSMFVVKETDFKKLGSVNEQKHFQLASSKMEIGSLKEQILRFEREIESKSSRFDSLNTQISSLSDEKDEANKELESVKKSYADTKISLEKQEESANLLEERRKKLKELKEQLVLALIEANNRKVIVKDLTNENNDFREILDFEVVKVEKLEEEVSIMQNEANDMKNEAEKLKGQLERSKSSCKKLELELLHGQREFYEARDASQKVFNDLKQSKVKLACDLASSYDAFAKTKEELKRVSRELQETSENRDDLMKEYVEAYKKLKSVDGEVMEEKKNVDSLKNVVEDLRGWVLMEDESRKVLKMYIGEAKRKLDKMNDKMLIQLGELNGSYMRIYGLEGDKKALNEAIDEHTEAAQEARESVEGVYAFVTKLEGDIEKLEKKRGELENELGFAKGEILRLKSEMTVMGTPEKVCGEDGDAGGKVGFRQDRC